MLAAGRLTLIDIPPALLSLPAANTTGFRPPGARAATSGEAETASFDVFSRSNPALAEPLAALLAGEAEPELLERGRRMREVDGIGDPLSVARQAEADGRAGDARAVLLAALVVPDFEYDAALGLAVLALREGRRREAAALAAHCLDRGVRHPRACILVGLGEHDEGRRASAQAHLAAAARIARNHPDLADDMRSAQRALLIMQL